MGPRPGHAPAGIVHAVRRRTVGGRNLPRQPPYGPFAHDTPERRRAGTRAEVTATYRAYPPARAELLELAPAPRRRTPACRCAPALWHGDVPAEPADSPW
ncbi:hypothetical protein ACIRPX_17120 [Streptomyces sp. NPDC101225]|uniref:hypothetical protein n=1 Tax=Streptomyces sp. NPDC101225 TaxID=3366135 RepID=UPI00380F91FC